MRTKKTNRYWSLEDKLRIIKKVIEDGRSSYDVATEEDISSGMLRHWVIEYNKFGESALVNKKNPGNPACRYQKKKNLTQIEELEYEIMKLRIENERLK